MPNYLDTRLGSLPRTGTFVQSLGSFNTLAELNATHPANNYNPGTTAYTVDQGFMISDGSVWESPGMVPGEEDVTAATYAAARLLSGAATGARLQVRGRTSQSDGGQGLFTWVAGGSTTIDDGIELTAPGGIWRRADNSPAPLGVAIRLEAFGSAVGGFYDAALAKAITALGVTGGGTLVFGPKTYAFANQFPIITTTGSQNAPPILLQGSGATFSGRWSQTPAGGTVLDLQSASSGSGKIFLPWNGYFGARNITFTDSTASGGAFIYTTNTVIDIDACAFIGLHSFLNGNVPADQDAVICGGTTTTLSGSSPTAAFQGYGSKITNSYFSAIRRGLYGRVYANAIRFTGNTIASGCGTKKAGVSTDTTAFVAFDVVGQTSSCVGNFVRDNLFECQYLAYPIMINGGSQNVIGPNGFYDAIGNTVAMIQLSLPLGTFTGTATAGQPTLTSVIAPSLTAGMFVSGPGIPSGSSVVSFIGTTVTLAHNSGISGSSTFSFSAPTGQNTIIAGNNATAVPLIEDNTNGNVNFIDDQQGSGNYSQYRSLVAYPQGGPAMANARFGSPEGGTPVIITPDFPANAGLPNNAARAGQIINGTAMLEVVQAAADGGAVSFRVNYDGSMILGNSAAAALISVNGQKWAAQGVGAQMEWGSGTGGSYGVLRHFGLKRGKFNSSSTYMQNAQNNADGTEIWTTNNYVTKNYIEVTTPITVAQLPAGVVGMKYIVNDATAPAFNVAVVGGGAVVVPVFYNGANWVVG